MVKMYNKQSNVKNPTKQIAEIMFRDAKRINVCRNINDMLEILEESNTKVTLLLKGLRGEVN